MLAMAISLPEMLASMLVLSISLLGMVASMLVLPNSFYLGWWSTCQCWPAVLPGIVVNMPLLAISFTWDGGKHASVGHQFTWDSGKHASVGHQFYLGWWPAFW